MVFFSDPGVLYPSVSIYICIQTWGRLTCCLSRRVKLRPFTGWDLAETRYKLYCFIWCWEKKCKHFKSNNGMGIKCKSFKFKILCRYKETGLGGHSCHLKLKYDGHWQHHILQTWHTPYWCLRAKIEIAYACVYIHIHEHCVFLQPACLLSSDVLYFIFCPYPSYPVLAYSLHCVVIVASVFLARP